MVNNMNRRAFLGKLGKIALAGIVGSVLGVPNIASGEEPKVSAEGVKAPAKTKEEQLREVIQCLKGSEEGYVAVSQFFSKGFAVGMIAKMNVDFVNAAHTPPARCKLAFGVSTNDFGNEYSPHIIYYDNTIVLSGEKCRQFQDPYIKLRDEFLGDYVRGLRTIVENGMYTIDKTVRDPIFVPDNKGYLSLVYKSSSTSEEEVFTMIDYNGDGTPEEFIVQRILKHEADTSKLKVLHTTMDPVLTKGLYKGLFAEIYNKVAERQKLPKAAAPKDKDLEEELESTLKHAIEGGMLR